MWNLAKKLQKRGSKNRPVLAIDLGGTKVVVAAVQHNGRILESVRERVDFSDEYKSLLGQITRMAHPLIQKYALKKGAIASAGPLDPVRGLLLNPTNFKGQSSGWGVVPLGHDLRKKLKIEIAVENDAAAAARAEIWLGAARGQKNAIIVTLGTGLGVGVIANGAVVRSGRHLHTEGGHIIMNMEEKNWLCGCGNYGCAEAYLSGVNFTKNLAKIWREPGLTGEILKQRALNGDKKAIDAFRLYGERLAVFFCSLCVLFSPEQIIISGGFSNSAKLFLPVTKAKLTSLMKTRRVGVDMMPRIKISKFTDLAGILGAACVALD